MGIVIRIEGTQTGERIREDGVWMRFEPQDRASFIVLLEKEVSDKTE